MERRNHLLGMLAGATILCAVGIGVGIGIGYGIFHKSPSASGTTTASTTYVSTFPTTLEHTTINPENDTTTEVTNPTTTTIPQTTKPHTPNIPTDYGLWAYQWYTLLDSLGTNYIFNETAFFTESIGPRYFGSRGLDNAIGYVTNRLDSSLNLNFWKEPVYGQAWKRGKESATLLTPRKYSMEIYGFGGSPPTPPEGIKAPAMVIRTLEEMSEIDANGSIIIFNPTWTTYENMSGYRDVLPALAHKAGAVAVLIRSATPFSVYSGHTGRIDTSPVEVPIASITVEDAAMLDRMHSRGQDLAIHLEMESSIENVTSSNIIIDIPGSTTPDEIVLISAHLDSWDIGQGALDDGVGVIMCLETMMALSGSTHGSVPFPYGGERPSRTIRAVLFTGEEVGMYGSKQYFAQHKSDKHVFVMEFDMGAFTPLGLTVATRTNKHYLFYEEIASLFMFKTKPPPKTCGKSNLNANSRVNWNPYAVGEDIQPLVQQGTPGATILWDCEIESWNYYLTFHHTEGDRVSQIKPDEAQAAFTALAIATGIIADTPQTSEVYQAEQAAIQQNRTLIFVPIDTHQTLPYPSWDPLIGLRGSATGYPMIPTTPWQILPNTTVNQTEFYHYDAAVDALYDILIDGDLKGKYFERLANITDTFGPRIIGSSNLNDAADYAMALLEEDGFANVHGENATLPYWVRGTETATITFANSPTNHSIKILGIGGTPGTDNKILQAPVVVALNLTHMKMIKDQVRGKIVVIAPEEWHSYSFMSTIRLDGPENARRYGAVACLVRSATARGVYTTHGGNQYMGPHIKRIPAAAITIEDADMIRRMTHDAGTPTHMALYMTSGMQGERVSLNTVAEIPGREKPDEIVLISGHFDSWDVGQGAMDDGVGALLCWHAMRAMNQLGLAPRRTIRLVMWTGEEIGGGGSRQYYEAHKHENIVFAAESNLGVFKPGGMMVKAESNSTLSRMKVILDRFGSKVNASDLYAVDSIGIDVDYWANATSMAPYHQDFNRMYDYYFTFHHSMADTMSVLRSEHLDMAAYLWATVTYIVADAEQPFLF